MQLKRLREDIETDPETAAMLQRLEKRIESRSREKSAPRAKFKFDSAEKPPGGDAP